MGRLKAYLLIALIGYIVGVAFYFVGSLVGEWVEGAIPEIVELVRKPEVYGPLLAGFTTALLAVILAYLWALGAPGRAYR